MTQESEPCYYASQVKGFTESLKHFQTRKSPRILNNGRESYWLFFQRNRKKSMNGIYWASPARCCWKLGCLSYTFEGFIIDMPVFRGRLRNHNPNNSRLFIWHPRRKILREFIMKLWDIPDFGRNVETSNWHAPEIVGNAVDLVNKIWKRAPYPWTADREKPTKSCYKCGASYCHSGGSAALQKGKKFHNCEKHMLRYATATFHVVQVSSGCLLKLWYSQWFRIFILKQRSLSHQQCRR